MAISFASELELDKILTVQTAVNNSALDLRDNFFRQAQNAGRRNLDTLARTNTMAAHGDALAAAGDFEGAEISYKIEGHLEVETNRQADRARELEAKGHAADRKVEIEQAQIETNRKLKLVREEASNITDPAQEDTFKHPSLRAQPGMNLAA